MKKQLLLVVMAQIVFIAILLTTTVLIYKKTIWLCKQVQPVSDILEKANFLIFIEGLCYFGFPCLLLTNIFILLMISRISQHQPTERGQA
jgi:hypothetical protein